MKIIFNKVLVLQNRLSHGHLSISIPKNFLWLLPKIEKKCISLNDNIIWCKNSSHQRFVKLWLLFLIYAVGIDMFKVNNRNTRTRCQICSKLTVKTSERRKWRRSGVFIANFKHISHLVLVFLWASKCQLGSAPKHFFNLSALRFHVFLKNILHKKFCKTGKASL